MKHDSEILETLDLPRLREIKRIERERFAKIDAGLIDHPIFLRPCRVKILMLVDTGISYNQFYFGLSEALDTLRLNPEYWVKFDITRAHRQTDPNKPTPGSAAEALYAPHFENFQFTQPGFDIDDYDQVWFFGFNSGQSTTSPGPGLAPTALTDAELEILFRWMDRGGGVFATGDHATLGASLCSRIPRVRNMRKWTAADGVPPASGATRHDTLLKGHDNPATAIDESSRYTFDDESDDVPMKIRPRWYHHHHCAHPHVHWHHWYWPYFHAHSPHPLLCGEDGVIDILPDHPHEGEVVTPSNLNQTLSFGSYVNVREYPDLAGSPLAPEVVAWARVQNDHTNVNSFKGTANGKEFGAIGAYEGHCVDVGRVVVDSTWHHWFDVNLTGRMNFGSDNPGSTDDPRKLNGFNDTPAGQAALARIRNYFRNIAIWLAPSAKQTCMVKRALWGSLVRYPLVEELHLKLPLWEIGHHAIDALGRYAGQCNVRRWWPILVRELSLPKLFDPERLTTPVEGLNMLDEFVLGGILREMLAAKEKAPDLRPDDTQLQRLAQRGAAEGLKAFTSHLEEVNRANTHLMSVVGTSLKAMDGGAGDGQSKGECD